RRLAPVADRPDDKRGAANDVAHGKDARQARRVAAEVGLHGAPAGDLQALDAPELRQVLRLESQRLDHPIGGAATARAPPHPRRLPPGDVRRAEPHLLDEHAFNGLAGGEAARRGQPDEVDALLLGVGDLALAARHVGPVAAVEALDRLRALADRGAHAVHRSVAAADDDDALALRVQFAGIEFRHVVAEALAVRGGQVVDGADDAGGTRVRPAEVAALVDAGGDDHGVVLAADRVEGEVLADIAVQHELDA